MSSITNEALRQLSKAGVETFFVSGAATKWWNAQRVEGSGTIRLFGGWYWKLRRREEGPFRCESAARRDAFYRGVLKIDPPTIDSNDLAMANRGTKKTKKVKLRAVA